MLLRLALALLSAAAPLILVDSVYVITRYEPSALLMNDLYQTDFLSSPNVPSRLPVASKRSAQSIKALATHEHVCKTIIKTDYQPEFGHEQNGTRVEIQQDERRQFRATFIECENTDRNECHGIDNALFTSECVTLYEFRPAGVRVAGSGAEFVDGLIKVPITCQCRLRRKLNRILISERP